MLSPTTPPDVGAAISGANWSSASEVSGLNYWFSFTKTGCKCVDMHVKVFEGGCLPVQLGV